MTSVAGNEESRAWPLHLWQAFDVTARSRAGQPALLLQDAVITFGQLHAEAEQAAFWLAGLGLRKGDVVALQLPKRRSAYVLWLACLRQGCPYVFLDPRNPESRTANILARLRPALVVGEIAVTNPFGHGVSLGSETDASPWVSAQAAHPGVPAASLTGLDPAYVMFTSGSTGEPKGAVIAHQGVLSLMRWAKAMFHDHSQVRFSNINPLHFDNSVFDLYGGLLNGAALVPVETGRMPNPARWVRRLCDAEASVIFAVPTLFQTLDRLKLLKPDSLPGTRYFIFGGEGFPSAGLAAFHARFRDQARLVNVYGPTETSCICSSTVIDEDSLAAAGTGFPSLGRMHDDFSHAVLDDSGSAVGPGIPGELWIGGPNVGLGYFANGAETARRFVQDPRQSSWRSVWYRSGDLVTEDADGLLWFVGRVDNQVKIRGHRIELEEVDLVVEAFGGVIRANTVAIAGPDGPELRCAYLGQSVIDADALLAHCRERLPGYMLPSSLHQLESLPTNQNGKVDRKAVAKLIGGVP